MPNTTNRKWKPIVFTAIVLVAITLILFLLVHKSNKREPRLCENEEELMYFSPGDGGTSNNGTCYMQNTQGPCERNQILIQKSENGEGECDCDNVHNQRALVYHSETNRCYFIFTQAFCQPEEWLVLVKNGPAKCKSNPCLSFSRNSDSSAEWVQLKDETCVELGKWDRTCKSKEEYVKFFQYKAFPACEYTKNPHKINHSIANVGVPATSCPPGHYRTHLGNCQIEFDFD